MTDDIFKVIQDHLAEKMELNEEEKSKLSRETTFDDLNYGKHHFDSLDQIDFVMDIERHFSISIPDDVFEKMHTLGDLESNIEKLINEHQKNADC